MAAKYIKLPALSAQFVDRFWSKVKILPSGCWEWQAAKGRYGSIWWNGHCYLPHRIAFKIYTLIDPETWNVCHSCDNAICCNPFHLWLGTQKDNCIDMAKKGRSGKAKGDGNGSRLYPERLKRGEYVHTALLNEAQVLEIRQKYVKREYNLKRLAAEFGVTFSTIHRVVTYQTWKHLP